jgi:hypothetical protein
MSGSDARLKTIVAAEHGLDHEAARLLVGETLAELETSAASLAKLLGERAGQEPPVAAAPDLFTAAAALKTERKRALLDALVGRASQPRDERGRFAAGFDGGARQQSVRRAESHEETLIKLLHSRRADAGARF